MIFPGFPGIPGLSEPWWFKAKENLSNTIMNDIQYNEGYIVQTRKLTYNLRSHTNFMRYFVNTKRFDLNLLCDFDSNEWNLVPLEIKNASNLHTFKNKIRKLDAKECRCNLCPPCVSNLGFVNLVKVGFN